MRRVTILAAALAVTLAPAAAHAKPVCYLVQDKAADTGLGLPASPVRTPAHDITSLDVATGKKTLMGVMRVTSTAVADDPAAKIGMYWKIDFRIGDVAHSFKRTLGQNGTFTDTATQNSTPIAGLVV